MKFSPLERQQHLERLEKHIAHILQKRGVGDGTNTFLPELILAVDLEIFQPTMTQEEWEALPLEKKYTPEQLEDMCKGEDE
jgi:hypothetical protein